MNKNFTFYKEKFTADLSEKQLFKNLESRELSLKYILLFKQ